MSKTQSAQITQAKITGCQHKPSKHTQSLITIITLECFIPGPYIVDILKMISSGSPVDIVMNSSQSEMDLSGNGRG